MGFDPVGASELSSSVRTSNVVGSNSVDHSNSQIESFLGLHSSENSSLIGLVDSTVWLGATDLTALFGVIGVRTSIIESRTPGPDGVHLS